MQHGFDLSLLHAERTNGKKDLSFQLAVLLSSFVQTASTFRLEMHNTDCDFAFTCPQRGLFALQQKCLYVWHSCAFAVLSCVQQDERERKKKGLFFVGRHYTPGLEENLLKDVCVMWCETTFKPKAKERK